MSEIKTLQFDDGPTFQLPLEAKDSLERYAIRIARCQREVEPEHADCWRYVRISIDNMFQPGFAFGESIDDVSWGDRCKDGNECCSWIIETN